MLTRPRPLRGMVLTVLSAAFEVGSLAALGRTATSHFTGFESAFPLMAGIAGALACVGLTRALADREYALLQLGLEETLRLEVTDAILAAGWEDFVDQPGHELQAAAVSEAPAVAQATALHEKSRSAMAGALVVLVASFAISPLTAAITFAFGLVVVVVYRASSNGLSLVQRLLAESNASMTRHTGILVSGLRSLRLSPVQHVWRDRMADLYAAHSGVRRGDFLIPVRSRLFVDLLVALMMFVVLMAQVALSQSLTAGIVVMALILRVVPRVQAAQQMSAYAKHGVEWLNRWEERLVSMSTAPRPMVRGVTTASDEYSEPLLSVSGVSFRYRSHARPVLDDVSFTVAKGEWVALRGASGGGKSTLIDVLSGLLQPTQGQVALLGTDIAQYPSELLYRLLVVVPQDVHLLGESVLDIVTWNGMLDDVQAASEASAALGVDDMFLFSTTELPAEVEVDEMSRNISGGMRTRLAMARALVGKPVLLILDETTSRLHPSAEAQIFASLRQARPDLGVLVVSHRSETTRLADRTLTLAHGRLTEDEMPPLGSSEEVK